MTNPTNGVPGSPDEAGQSFAAPASQGLFHVSDTAVDEGPSSFGDSPPNLHFGVPAPTADGEVHESSMNFAQGATGHEADFVAPATALRRPLPAQPVPPAQPVQQYAQPVPPVQQYAQPVPPVQQYAQPVPPVQQYAQPVPPVPAQPAPPVQQYAQPVPPVPAQPVAPVPAQQYAQPVPPAQQYAQPVAPVPTQPVQQYAQPVQPVAQVPQPVQQSGVFGPPPGQPHSYFADVVSDQDFARPADTLVGRKHGKGAGKGKKVVAGSLAGLLVLGGGTAYAAAEGIINLPFLGGGGAQPEEILPADTLGYIKLDLNPGVDQKVAVARLVTKFPALSKHTGGPEEYKDNILGAAVDGADIGLDYAADVKPWVGDRVAFAGVPGVEEPHAVMVLAHNDEAKAKAALTKADTEILKMDSAEPPADEFEGEFELETEEGSFEVTPASSHTVEDDFHFAVTKDWVIVSDSQAVADAIATGKSHLGDNAQFKDDLAALDGNQIITAWADYGRFADALPEDIGLGLNPLAALGSGAVDGGDAAAKPVGRVVVGVRAASDMLEIKSITRDAKPVQNIPSFGQAPVNKDIQQRLSVDALGALSVSGLGDFMTAMYKTVAADDVLGVAEQAQDLGINPETDLAAVFGSNLTVGLTADVDSEEFGAALLVTSPDPDRAAQVLNDLSSLSGEPDITVQSDHKSQYSLVVGPLGQALAAPGDKPLGGHPLFAKTVANPDSAGMVAFIDLGRIIDAFNTEGDLDDVKALGALGMSATSDGTNGTATVRLTFR